jgi:hypothetical protein
MLNPSLRALTVEPCWLCFKIYICGLRHSGVSSYSLRFGRLPLQPYKKAIDPWLWPDVFREQETSVSIPMRAVTDYKKAIGDPDGLAELTVFYCERAAGFCGDVCAMSDGDR